MHTNIAYHLYISTLTCLLFTGCIINGNEIIKGPLNEAAQEGDEARFNCTVHLTTDRIHWRFYNVDGSEPVEIYKSNEGIQSGYEEDYDIDFSEDGDYEKHDLIVNSVTTSITGRYNCDLPLDNEDVSSAELVEVGDMTCLPAPGEVTVDEGDMTTFHCYVSFSGYVGPVLQYSDSSGSRPPVVENRTENAVSLVSNVTADASYDERDIICWLTFTTPSQDGKPPPDYTDTCVTHVLVNHPVTGIGFSPDPDNYPGVMELEVGDHINCTASGRPEPSYVWQSETDGLVVDGYRLDIESHMVGTEQHYVCRATNEYKGEEYNSMDDIYFLAVDPSSSGSDVTRRIQWEMLSLLLIVVGANNI